MERNLRTSYVWSMSIDLSNIMLMGPGFANEKEIRPKLKEKKRSDFLSVRSLFRFDGQI